MTDFYSARKVTHTATKNSEGGHPLKAVYSPLEEVNPTKPLAPLDSKRHQQPGKQNREKFSFQSATAIFEFSRSTRKSQQS